MPLVLTLGEGTGGMEGEGSKGKGTESEEEKREQKKAGEKGENRTGKERRKWRGSIELRFYIPLDTKQVISEMLSPANQSLD